MGVALARGPVSLVSFFSTLMLFHLLLHLVWRICGETDESGSHLTTMLAASDDAPMTRRPLQLSARSTPAGSPPASSPSSTPAASSRASPFGAAKPIDTASKERELEELTRQSSAPDLWDDPAAAQTLMRRAEELRGEIATWNDLETRATALAEVAEMAAAEPDAAPQRVRVAATEPQRWMGLLERLRPLAHWSEFDEFPLIGRLVVGPDRLHRLDPLARQLVAGTKRGAMVLDLVAVPAVADAEQEAPLGELVDR